MTAASNGPYRPIRKTAPFRRGFLLSYSFILDNNIINLGNNFILKVKLIFINNIIYGVVR